jgi:ubiquitin-protein ligase
MAAEGEERVAVAATPPRRREAVREAEGSPFAPERDGSESAALGPLLGGYGDGMLRDYALQVEYRAVKRSAPSGVAVVPDSTSLRRWCGVVLVSSGAYSGGVWPFVLSIPDCYPAASAASIPTLRFLLPAPYHPLVDPKTGRVSLSLRFPDGEWNPEKDRLLHVVQYAREIFFLAFSDMDAAVAHKSAVANPAAAAAWSAGDDKSEFLNAARRDALDSAARNARGYWSRLPATALPFDAEAAPSDHVDRLRTFLLEGDTDKSAEDILSFLSNLP